MSVKPILFNTEMVQAILSGRKTATRRPIKPTDKSADRITVLFNGRNEITGAANTKNGAPISDIKTPYSVGDILYVRETWAKIPGASSKGGYAYKYKASDEGEYWSGVNGFKWKPSIHMPKEAARIWLMVTNIRIERVEDITEEQAHAEGFYRGWQHPGLPNSTPSETARQAFIWIWHKLYGIMNDYVWVIEFTRVEKPEN